MNKETCWKIIGGLSEPSKMPCFSWSIPAKFCKTGAKLRAIPGSICSKCYACKGMYGFPVVRAALQRRFDGMDNPLWVEAFSTFLNEYQTKKFFRFFDSGDIQSVENLQQIVRVCKACPSIKFWLPTHEFGFVAKWLGLYGAFPENLTVRLSAVMLNGAPPVALAARLGVQTSSAVTQGATCPAPNQGGKCNECRLCWNKKVTNIAYLQH